MQFEFLRTIVGMLDAAGIPHMLAGSMASTFHGEPRMTRNIDLVIDPTPESIERFVASLDRSRVPPARFVDVTWHGKCDRQGIGVAGRPCRPEGTTSWP